MGKSLKDFELSIDDLKKAVGGQGTYDPSTGSINVDGKYTVNLGGVDEACMNQLKSIGTSCPGACSTFAQTATNAMGEDGNILGLYAEMEKLLAQITAECISAANDLFNGQLCPNAIQLIQ